MDNLDTFVREFLLGKDPLISPHAKYLSGELPVKKLSDDKNWIDQMENVGVVKEEREFGDYEDVLYYPKKAIIEELDEDNYQSDKNEWYDYNYKGIFDLILRARKNLEGDISEKLRQNILDFVEAISPIVFDYHPQIHNGLRMRFESAIPTAFKSALTVEVCDANHVLVVRDAIKTANNGGIDKFENFGFAFDAKGLIIFKFEKVKRNDNFVWDGQTLTGLRAADSYKLLEPYLLRRKDDLLNMYPYVPEEKI